MDILLFSSLDIILFRLRGLSQDCLNFSCLINKMDNKFNKDFKTGWVLVLLWGNFAWKAYQVSQSPFVTHS